MFGLKFKQSNFTCGQCRKYNKRDELKYFLMAIKLNL